MFRVAAYGGDNAFTVYAGNEPVSPFPIPFEIILVVSIAADIALAYFGINLFKSLRKKLKARRKS